jgi:hypothetical protein
MRNEMALCTKMMRFHKYAGYALLTDCSTPFHTAASELERSFSCSHKVEVFPSLLNHGENAERVCKAA